MFLPSNVLMHDYTCEFLKLVVSPAATQLQELTSHSSVLYRYVKTFILFFSTNQNVNFR